MFNVITCRQAYYGSQGKTDAESTTLDRNSSEFYMADAVYAFKINLQSFEKWNQIMDEINKACKHGLFWCRVSGDLFESYPYERDGRQDVCNHTLVLLRYIAYYVDEEKSGTFHIYWGDNGVHPSGWVDG